MNPTLLLIHPHLGIARLFERRIAEARIKVKTVIATTPEGVRDLVKKGWPEFALIAPGMEGFRAERVANALAAEKVNCQVMAMIEAEDVGAILMKVRSKLAGIFHAKDDPEEWLAGLRKVLAGGSYWTTTVTEARMNLRDDSGEVSRPSDGDLVVLEAMVEAGSNKAIQTETGLSEKSVEHHVANLRKWFGVDDRTQLLLRAKKLGYLE